RSHAVGPQLDLGAPGADRPEQVADVHPDSMPPRFEREEPRGPPGEFMLPAVDDDARAGGEQRQQRERERGGPDLQAGFHGRGVVEALLADDLAVVVINLRGGEKAAALDAAIPLPARLPRRTRPAGKVLVGAHPLTSPG